MSRPYRENLKNHGQSSPPQLSDYAIRTVKKIQQQLQRPVSIVDIGCGSGAQMQRIISQVGAGVFSKIVGVDWSQKAVDLLASKNIFTQTLHCQSSQLPINDKEFDIAISIENLEHLYEADVIPAINELKRIAAHVILITPLPRDVINHQFLGTELPNAEKDNEPIGYHEYIVLEGTIHKSIVYPDSMRNAGFNVEASQHGYYTAQSDNIDASKISVRGLTAMPLPTNPATHNFSENYVQLLRNSKDLKHD